MATTKLPRIVGESLYFEKEAPHRWELVMPVAVTLSSGEILAIPAGYVTDFASVPQIFWGIIASTGRHNLAVLIHDYLLSENTDRATADREMLYWLEASNVNFFKSRLMYIAVRTFGIIKTSFSLR